MTKFIHGSSVDRNWFHSRTGASARDSSPRSHSRYRDVPSVEPTWLRASLGALFNWGEQPARSKIYPDAEQFELPKPQKIAGLSLEAAITTRRSRRDYTNAALSLPSLSQVLHLAQGITDQSRELRAVPSAGALYPLEIYAFVHRVEQLPTGIDHYAIENHRL